jgi:hypothetical protein
MIRSVKLAVVFISFVLFSFSFAACQSAAPPVEVSVPFPVEVEVPLIPFSMEIYQRLEALEGDLNKGIGKFQLYLAGRVRLDLDGRNPVAGVGVGGSGVVSPAWREIITINNLTPGRGLGVSTTKFGDVIISVKFDEQGKTGGLIFSADSHKPGDYFYLTYDEARGTGTYENRTYRVKFPGNTRPYLLIKLEGRELDRSKERVLQGVQATPYY